jgi:hypothetical protein
LSPIEGRAARGKDASVDADQLAALVAEYGADFLAEVVSSVERDAPPAMAALARAAEAGDAVTAADRLHFVKGSLLCIALACLAGEFERHEKAARSGTCLTPADVAALSSALADGLAALRHLGLGRAA